MIEIAFFLGLAGIFYYVISKYSETDENKVVTVGEEKAKAAPDQFNIYEGINTEDLINSLLEKAHRLYKAGAFRNAEKMFLEVLKNDPKNIEAYKGLGKIYFEEKKNDQAEASFEKATVLDESDEESWLNLGLLYYEDEDYKKAAFSYEKVIGLNKKSSVDTYQNLAIIYTKLNNFEEAAVLLEKAIKIKQTKELYKFLFGIYKNLGDISRADKVMKLLEEMEKSEKIEK